jgi:hypothetical protein
MADWAHLFFQARLHAAHEPGFLAVRHLELVALNGGHVGFCINLGIDMATPAGREAANFHAALIIFCWELCQQGLGHLPYHPAPFNHGPMGPIAAGPPEDFIAPPAHDPPVPPADEDFVEIVGGVHPVHGPWAVDHDFVEIVGGFDPVHGPWVEGPGEDVPNQDGQLLDVAGGGEGNGDGELPLQGMEDGELPDPNDWDFDINLFLQ